MDLENSSVLILGITFKENCDDIRNSKVIDLYQELCSRGINTVVFDPIASETAVIEEYGISLAHSLTDMRFDAIILAVAHDIFLEMRLSEMVKLYNTEKKLFYDVKGIVYKEELSAFGIEYMHL